jgi:acetyl-CoA C-acetyltransferase
MNIVVVTARRTPIGAFMGSLKDISAVDLGVQAARAVLSCLPRKDVTDVIVGNVL